MDSSPSYLTPTLPWDQFALDDLATLTHKAHRPRLFEGDFVTEAGESETPAPFAKLKPAFKEKPTTTFTFIDRKSVV